jgi:hypothetical protein
LPDARTPGAAIPERGLAARHPLLASARARFATGVVLAILVGFLPAHLVAGMRERNAFGAIDRRVVSAQAAADTPERYAALAGFRSDQLDAKRRARRAIMLTSLAIWAASGGVLAGGWFWLFRSPGALRRRRARPPETKPFGDH